MKIFSFDGPNIFKLKRDKKQFDLFDLFQQNIIYNDNIEFKEYIVPREFEMRLDRISNQLYGNVNYVEELMLLNNILNPWSVKEGQIILFCDINIFNSLYNVDNMLSTNDDNKDIIKKSGTTNNIENKNLPLTIIPNNLKQINISNDNEVKIINSFE